MQYSSAAPQTASSLKQFQQKLNIMAFMKDLLQDCISFSWVYLKTLAAEGM